MSTSYTRLTLQVFILLSWLLSCLRSRWCSISRKLSTILMWCRLILHFGGCLLLGPWWICLIAQICTGMFIALLSGLSLVWVKGIYCCYCCYCCCYCCCCCY